MDFASILLRQSPFLPPANHSGECCRAAQDRGDDCAPGTWPEPGGAPWARHLMRGSRAGQGRAGSMALCDGIADGEAVELEVEARGLPLGGQSGGGALPAAPMARFGTGWCRAFVLALAGRSAPRGRCGGISCLTGRTDEVPARQLCPAPVPCRPKASPMAVWPDNGCASSDLPQLRRGLSSPGLRPFLARQESPLGQSSAALRAKLRRHSYPALRRHRGRMGRSRE